MDNSKSVHEFAKRFLDALVHIHDNEAKEKYLKDRRRQPEGVEWEPIKIPHRKLAYIPESIRCPSSNSVKTA
jgi:hypothetical protein